MSNTSSIRYQIEVMYPCLKKFACNKILTSHLSFVVVHGLITYINIVQSTSLPDTRFGVLQFLVYVDTHIRPLITFFFFLKENFSIHI